MQSLLSPSHYLSSDIYALEQERLFRSLWIFACMTSAVAEDQAFATRKIGGVPVIVQNCEGRIRAFENSCPHRLMPLQSEEFGQAKLQCPYHGWVFDQDGAAKSIPKEATLYAFPPAEREKLCLREYAVTTIGQLVFVNLDPNPIDIQRQFKPELISELEAISSHFGTAAVHLNTPARYNWKLNFENVLDANHVPYVHPKSFQPLVIHGRNEGQAATTPDSGGMISDSLADQSFHSTTRMQIEPWPWHQMVDRYGEEGVYHNFFLFPNVNFISVGGLTFLVQQFDPVSATETQVRFTLCAAKENVRLPALPAILRGHLRGEVTVYNEDLVYLENLQSALHAQSNRVQHGKYEHRIQSFAAAYLKCLDDQPL